MNTREPAHLHLASTRIRGNPARRLMLILRTRGCTHALRPGGGCRFCGFRELSTQGAPVSGNDILAQFEKGLGSYDMAKENVQEIDIYNSGSFLSSKEVPPPVREEIFEIMAENPRIIKILIESRPEFIIGEEAHLGKLRNMVKDKILEVGIGLETVRDDIRNEELNKGFMLADFVRASEVLAKYRLDLLAYVLLKPPCFSEVEAIRDAIDTIYFLQDLGQKLHINVKVALQPTFVARNTPLEDLYNQRTYTPPSLWSVVEVIRGTFNVPLEIEVALSDEGLAEGRVPHSCELCNEEMREALRTFNETQDRKILARLKCPCRLRWKEGIKWDNTTGGI